MVDLLNFRKYYEIRERCEIYSYLYSPTNSTWGLSSDRGQKHALPNRFLQWEMQWGTVMFLSIKMDKKTLRIDTEGTIFTIITD